MFIVFFLIILFDRFDESFFLYRKLKISFLEACPESIRYTKTKKPILNEDHPGNGL